MILDALTALSAAQVVTADAASTNYLDAKANVRVSELQFRFRLSAVAGTNPTLAIKVQGSTDAAFTTPVEVGAITPTLAADPAIQTVYIKASARPVLRYYRAYYDIGGTDTPSVTVSADVVLTEQANYQAP